MLLTDTLHIYRPHSREELTRAMCVGAHLSLSLSLAVTGHLSKCVECFISENVTHVEQ